MTKQIMKTKSEWFRHGMRHGIPIAAGYFAVSFALGIAARTAGMTAVQASVASFFITASAGEYVGFTLIAAQVGYFEVFLMEAVTNARYLLMSSALSQKLDEKVTLPERLLLGAGVTDEIFGISVSVHGKLNPLYTYGAMAVAIPGWTLGTCLGVVLGNILPTVVVGALGVSLYGMFIAIFIPLARKNKVITVLVLIGFVMSYVFHTCRIFDGISSGVKIICLTVLISLAAAILCPIKEQEAAETRPETNEPATPEITGGDRNE